jgi:hypothetical protein
MQSGHIGFPQLLQRTRVSRSRWFAHGTGSPAGTSSHAPFEDGRGVTGDA